MDADNELEIQTPVAESIVVLCAKAVASLGKVYKDGKNKSQGYAYASNNAIVSAVGPAISEQGIVLTVEVVESKMEAIRSSNGAAGFRCEMKVIYKLIGPAGDALQYIVISEGQDYGDKSIRKAMTSAYKTFLLQAFFIATADQDDADAADPEPQIIPATGAQRQRIIDLCGGLAQAKTICKKLWDGMSTDQAEEVIRRIEIKNSKKQQPDQQAEAADGQNKVEDSK